MAGGALSFREDPFRLTPDRRYIFETDGFRRAFAMLLAGVRARRGAMLLTGPSGTGKTTLLQGLMSKLQHDGVVVFWRFHPDIPGFDLLGSCLAELEIRDAPSDAAARARALAKAVKARTPNLPAVLIVDETGQFADAQIAEIVSLPAATDGAVQVILAGLPAVSDRLDGDAFAAAKQAIALRAELGPLARGELGAYIAHRCRVAGQAGPLVFEPAAIARVFDHTGGTPRLVNRLCATALFLTEPGAKQVTAAVVDEAALACEGNSKASPPRQDDAGEAPQRAEVEPMPERPALRAAPSEVHRTLAEAERAWITGGAAKAMPQLAPRPVVEPAPQAEKPAMGGPVALPATPSVLPIDETVFVAAATTPRRRSPVLRIAASVAIVAGSAAVLAAVLWPTSIGHDYLVDSGAVKTVARLLVPDARPPEPTVAEAVVPPQPAAPEPPAQTIEPMAKPVVAELPPQPKTPEPVSAQSEPEPLAPKPETVVASHVVVVAPPEPAAIPPETPQPSASEIAAPALAAIEPANGPAAELPTEAKDDMPPVPVKTEPSVAIAAIAPTPVPEPPPVSAAAPAEAAPAKAPEPAPVAAIIPPPSRAPARTAQASAPAMAPAELQQLMARGDEMLRLGDPASARLFYERAASQGLARAYTAVGRTYDPMVLQRLNIRGGGPNGEQALAWYRRGSEAGDKDATAATSELTAWLARAR